jgi:hypothetical protein
LRADPFGLPDGKSASSCANSNDFHHEWPHVLQLVALQPLQAEAWELVNSPSLLWLTVERSFVTFLPLQVGQTTFSFPKTRTSKSLSHLEQ